MKPPLLNTVPTFLVLLQLFFQYAAANYGYKSVSTSFGVVRGETISPGVDDLPTVTQYLGIPYGVAPTGQYRFNMAISAAKWTHQPKDTFTLSNACMQSGLPHLSETDALKVLSAQRFDYIHRLLPFLKPQSEDCLYMNLFVPERLERYRDSPSSNQRSVLVIVHGDDFGWGSGNAYNASILSSHGQVIVVTLNYRLGAFGFLGRCEQSSCTGNAGLSDVVAALKMLSNILPAFGGDPSSVTLMGWGSGAAMVSLLMASPITQPKSRLFRRAILLDGSALSPWAISGHPQSNFFKIAEHLGCYKTDKSKDAYKRNDYFNQDISTVVRCIQDHSERNLTLAAKRIHIPTFLSAFAPIVDGQIVPNHPRISFSPKFGALFRDIDLLVGTVSHPAHHLMPNADAEHGIDEEKRNKILRTLVRNLYDYHRSEILDAVVTEYTDWENPKNHPKAMRNGVMAALGDALFTTPLVETARMHSTDEVPQASNTFFFVFSHETKSWTKEQPSSGVRGALSADHVPYILGYPLAPRFGENQLFSGFSNEDRSISKVMMHYVANFAKSGDPSKPVQLPTTSTIEERYHSTPWPQYNQAGREAYLEIDLRPKVKNYYRNSFVGFWSSFVPQLNRGTQEDIPEEHNLLPDHFNKQSFFGYVRPYSALHNDPFPPPPLPPTPLPKDLRLPNATTTPKPSVPKSNGEDPKLKDKLEKQYADRLSQMLVIVVIVGIIFFVLNICGSIAFVRMRKNGSNEKKMLKYQSYAATGQLPPGDLNYIPNSPLSQQVSLPPPPPGLIANNNSASASERRLLERQATIQQQNKPPPFPGPLALHRQSLATMNPPVLSKSSGHQVGGYTLSHGPSGSQYVTTSLNGSSETGIGLGPPRLSLHEQEPLLTGSGSKSSTPGLMRPPGISPTCPRHGRAAQMLLAQQGRANSMAGSAMTLSGSQNIVGAPPTLEEVQV